MELLTIILTAGLVLVATFLYAKRAKFVRRVDAIPGPVGWPLLGNVMDVLVPRNRLMEVIEMRHKEWAPIYRMWSGPVAEVHLTVAEHVEIIMSNVKHTEKSLAYKFLQPWLGHGLLTSKGTKWHSHRKLITPTFHFKILDVFMEIFTEKSEILVNKLMVEAGGKEFDIYPYITHCALDIICETAMGTQLNAQEETESEYISAIYEVSELTLQRAIRPWLHPHFVFQFTERGRRYEHCLQVLHGFTNKVIQERKQSRKEAEKSSHITDNEDEEFLGKKKRLAFLDLLLEASENGNQLSDIDIREEVDTFMFEGHDTTTAAICWSLLLLGEHPDIQEKVFEELDAIFQGSDRSATMRDVQEMKYLERVVKETLRLYPSVPFIGRRLKEDVVIGEYTLPAGVMVNLHIFHVHRDPQQYPNPERFDPDNFLPERVQGRHPYAYIPFSAGPRNCIGQKFALLEEKTVLSTILRKYKVISAVKREELTLMNELILRPESGIQVRLTSRAELKCEITKRDEAITDLQQLLDDRTDELESYQRRNSLRIFGVPETSGEDTDKCIQEIATRINVPIDPAMIDRSHRDPKLSVELCIQETAKYLKAQAERLRRLRNKRYHRPLRVVELVLVKRPAVSDPPNKFYHKFAELYIGPYRVIQNLDNNAYKVNRIAKEEKHVVTEGQVPALEVGLSLETCSCSLLPIQCSLLSDSIRSGTAFPLAVNIQYRMDLTIIISLLIGAITLVYLVKLNRKRSRFVRMVNMIPGPPAVPLLGTVISVLGTPREDLFSFFDRRTKLFYPVFRTWAGPVAGVHLMLPEHIELILGNTTHLEKSRLYTFLHPWLGTGLLTSKGSKWHTHRKMITPTFHFKILESFMDVFIEKSNILVEKLKKEVDNSGFNIYPYLTNCTLDIICETAMGTAINAQEATGSEYVSAIYEIAEITIQRLLRPWLYLDFIFYLSPMGRKYKADIAVLHGFTKKVIKERKKALIKCSTDKSPEADDDSVLGQKKRKAFLDLLLEASEGGKLLSDEEIREEVDTFMFEGHDTTSAAICWALFLLGSHQGIQDKVFEELDEIFQGSDRPATMRDLQEMKYLEMVIKESLRLYPSVPFIGRILQEDVKVGKYTVPAGCMVLLQIYHLHRNPENFPNPDVFNPDNFLPDRIQGRHPYAYIPFSAGPRNCIGQKFALQEEKTILSSVLRNYKVTSLDKIEDLHLISELILRPQNGMRVTIHPRKQSK
ncbi:uncharacterized protein [Anabrus simplex]|uniref:uncharacterized protein n=1 Tax=Anabrus simplex TaxID=316456 RepID=UPI0035A2C9C8